MAENTKENRQMAQYEAQGYNRNQLEEIRLGLEEGLNVSIYADKTYFAIQMRQIRFGLEAGLDVSIYAKKEFDWFQMEEIRMGLEEGLDASVYAKPAFSYEVMRQLRKALQDNIHLEKYASAGPDMLRELHHAVRDQQNIFPYIKAGYVPEQLREIRHALNHGCDVMPYLDTAYRGVAIKEIWKGLEKDLDVKLYANPLYSWLEMREIREGLEHRLDVTVYAKELYNWRQMRQIRLGLEEHLDIEQYKSMMHSSSEMKRIRLSLLEKRKEQEKLLQKPKKDDMYRQMEEYCINYFEKDFRIIVSADKMRVYAFAGKDAPTPTREEIENQLLQRRVTTGIRQQDIDKIAAGESKNELVLIAEGTLPTKGADGYYEFHFEDEHKHKPQMKDDGTADYEDIVWFQKVYMGQTLAVYHPAEHGTDGVSVEGKIVPGLPGKEKEVLKGNGFKVLDDGVSYISEEQGCVIIKDNKIRISHLFELDEATSATGDIDYLGSVYIRGDVRGNITIRAQGDVAIDGFVENAVISCTGSIFVKKGANGNGQGKLVAGDSVQGRFFENISIEAEKIASNYFLLCNLRARKSVEAFSSIAGGNVYAGYSIKAKDIGNKNGIETVLKAGTEGKPQENDYAEQLKEADRQLLILNNALEEYRRKYPPEVRNAMPIFLKVEDAVYAKKTQRQEIDRKIKQLEKERQRLREASLKVRGTLFEGTTVTINDAKFEVSTLKNVELKNEKHHMTVFHNE